MPVPVFLSGEHLTAAKLQQLLGAWTAYTPTLTSSGTQPALGSGGDFAQAGKWQLRGDMVDFMLYLRFGNSGNSAGTGTYRLLLPTAAVDSARENVGLRGTCELGDNSSGIRDRLALGLAVDNLHVTIQGTNPLSEVSATAPWAWAASDYIIAAGTYRSAA